MDTNDLRRAVAAKGGTLECDTECQCYRAMAPDGYRWNGDLTELVAVYGDGMIGNYWTRAQARADLFGRLSCYELERYENA